MPLFRMSRAVVFLFLLGSAINSKADPNYIYHICSNITTLTPNSTYQSNLNTLLSFLASNSTSNDGFHNTTTGQTPDIVYGLFLCRGNVSTYVCQDSVTFAAQDLVQRCPVEKAGVICYDECLLRYFNRYFFNNASEASIHMYKTQNSSNRSSYQDLVLATVNDTAIQAQSVDSILLSPSPSPSPPPYSPTPSPPLHSPTPSPPLYSPTPSLLPYSPPPSPPPYSSSNG